MSGHRGRYLVAVFTVVPPHTWQNVCGGSVASSLSAASTNDSVRNTRSASTADAWSHLLIVFTADVNPAHNTVTRVIRKHAHKRTRGMLLSNGRNPAAVGRLSCWRRMGIIPPHPPHTPHAMHATHAPRGADNRYSSMVPVRRDAQLPYRWPHPAANKHRLGR